MEKRFVVNAFQGGGISHFDSLAYDRIATLELLQLTCRLQGLNM